MIRRAVVLAALLVAYVVAGLPSTVGYSAVYGVFRNNGTRLYIIDAMSGAEHACSRGRSGAWNPVPVDRSIREPAQRLIREHVDEIRRVYRLPPYR